MTERDRISTRSDEAPPLFASKRERRLWAWTGVVVVAIYSTLGLATTLAAELRNRELIDTTFFWAFVAIGVAIVLLGLGSRPRGAEIGIGIAVAAVYLMVFLRMGIPEERTHLIEYSVVAAFMHEALLERAGQGRRVPRPALLAIVLATAVGAVDELIQLVLPSRVFDPIDVAFNTLAAVMAVSAGAAVRWAGDRRDRPGR